MIDSVHQSTLAMALRCGEQFRRRYILGQIIPPSIAMARGTALHAANETNLVQKVGTKKDLPLSDLQDAARDSYVRSLRNGIFLSKPEASSKDRLVNEGLNQSLDLTTLYHAEVAPEIVPIEVERPFKIDLGLGLPIAGRIDHEQSQEVDDLKSASKSWVEGKINREIQPVFYSIAHENEFNVRPLFRYHILVALKRKPKRQVQERICTDADYNALFARIETFIKMIQSGVFPPAEIGTWACSEKYCGYHSTCVYVGNGPAKKWI